MYEADYEMDPSSRVTSKVILKYIPVLKYKSSEADHLRKVKSEFIGDIIDEWDEFQGG